LNFSSGFLPTTHAAAGTDSTTRRSACEKIARSLGQHEADNRLSAISAMRGTTATLLSESYSNPRQIATICIWRGAEARAISSALRCKTELGPPTPATPLRPSTNGLSIMPRNWLPSWNAPCWPPVASPESCVNAFFQIAAGEPGRPCQTGLRRVAKGITTKSRLQTLGKRCNLCL